MSDIMDIDCLEYQANDEFVFYPGAVVDESSANIKCSQKSKISNLKPIPITETPEFDHPNIMVSAVSTSPPIPQEVIELLPMGLRNLSPSDGKRCRSGKSGHRRKLSHNYDYLHDLVTCDAIQVLTSRPTPLPPITRSALSSARECNKSVDLQSGENSCGSSATNSLSSTSSISVDSGHFDDHYHLYNQDHHSEFDDYDNFTIDIEDNTVREERPMGIYVTDCGKECSVNFKESNAVSVLNDDSSHRLSPTDEYNFSYQNDEFILKECMNFIHDNSDCASSSDDEDEGLGQHSNRCKGHYCNSIYDNVTTAGKTCPNNNTAELLLEPVGRPPCSPTKRRRPISPRRRESSSLRRRDIPRRRHSGSRTNSAYEKQTVFQNKGIDSLPNDDDSKKDKKNKSFYHFVKKLLA